MIDINLIRDEKKRLDVIRSEKSRFRSIETVKEIAELDKTRAKKRYTLDVQNMHVNRLKKEIKNLRALSSGDSKEEYCAKNTEFQELKKSASSLAEELKVLDKRIHTKLCTIGNILSQEVVVSKSEEENKVIRQYKSNRDIKGTLPYNVIFDKIQGCDTKRGARVMGHRGYFLLEELALLKNALVAYAVDFARERGYKLVQTPVMMKKEEMAKTAQLSDFDEQLYKVEDGLYLIATSEQPLSVMHAGERFSQKELPIRYVGQSLCFRKEAGAHGKDNRGIYRVHQFDKVEQFVICSPEDSRKFFEEMIGTAEEFYRSLDISYRVVSIVSGEMNDAASIKYDLEAYFPETKRYRELVSCSNCTDHQSRSAEIRYGYAKKNGCKEYVHMLNATLVAVQRALCCIVENYQDEDGVSIPEVLRPYYRKCHISFKK